MATTSTVITADDLLLLPDDGTRRELVRGVIRSFPFTSAHHGIVTMNVSRLLAEHIFDHQLGDVYAAGTGFILARNPDTVRAPDVAFVRQERSAALDVARGYVPEAPDLVIEVISPNDVYSDVQEKVTEYLNAGTGMVIIVNPRNNTVQVYRALGGMSHLTQDDIIDGENIVPGWTCPVRRIFT